MVDQAGFENIEFSGLWSVWEGRTRRNKAGLHTGVWEWSKKRYLKLLRVDTTTK